MDRNISSNGKESDFLESLPTRGAWIEIINSVLLMMFLLKSLPTRGAWIEIEQRTADDVQGQSLPTRGAWIEMMTPCAVAPVVPVAPHAGSVDRNTSCGRWHIQSATVAPHAGSVDRNAVLNQQVAAIVKSLPTRGAWIEIACS